MSLFCAAMTKKHTPVSLSRNCPARPVSGGDELLLAAGTSVTICEVQGEWMRISTVEGTFLVAMGDAVAAGLPGAQTVGEAQLLDVLGKCLDPDIPISIVELGTLYDLALEPVPGGLVRVGVTLTVSTPGSREAPLLVRQVHDALKAVPGVADVQVRLAWDPEWTPAMITDKGREILGLPMRK